MHAPARDAGLMDNDAERYYLYPVKIKYLNDTAIYSFCSDTYLSTLINTKAISLSDIILHITCTTISLSSILKRYSNDAVKSPLLNVAAGGITLASL